MPASQYLEKLTAILTLHPVRSLHVVHMEVPCCSGTTALARQALARSGKDDPHPRLHDLDPGQASGNEACLK